MESQIQAKVNEWLAFDKNPATRAEIESLRDAGNTEELKRRLMKRIEFGTAGLRGLMAAGFSCMNDLIVIQASQGLCAYVLQNVPNATERGVVVGHDHRYNSEKWAQLTAAAFVQGIQVSKLNAAAGVMITGALIWSCACRIGRVLIGIYAASHNPKDDNGYKVYWENAVQIISPHDAGIAAAIEANLQPIAWDLHSLANVDNLVIDRTEEMTVAYLDYIASLSHWRLQGNKCFSSSQVYQYSMHGVSRAIIDRANKVFDFKPLEHVKEQQDPNPDFPTVAFPNPKKGALDLAIKTANASVRRTCLHKILIPIDSLPLRKKKLAMVASTVSSKLIGAMAAKEGFKFVESLTGFKYIGNAARALEAEGYNVLFGYEEAIGSCLVKKFMCFAELVSSLIVGKTSDRLLGGDLCTTSNSYFICSQSEIVDQIFARLRSYNDPASLSKDKMSQYPKSIGGLTVMDIRDLTTGHGFDSSAPAPEYAPSLPVSGGHMITFKAKGYGVAIVLTVRTSGTEPKWFTREQVTKALARVVDELRDEWMQAKLHNLGIPGA
ncbi:phosphohexose mutase family [Rhizoctonia solani]|uniref:Phosphohexose mutase family n=1 Tax=Rhizoctonia solani TaxID=456999 RepID=A0A8H7M1G4_9AGAM|nr:phosphohexose mutase family [Rhizoctonia solani]